jgi:hypothetical protein
MARGLLVAAVAAIAAAGNRSAARRPAFTVVSSR